jgi:hypothetical protein
MKAEIIRFSQFFKIIQGRAASLGFYCGASFSFLTKFKSAIYVPNYGLTVNKAEYKKYIKIQ